MTPLTVPLQDSFPRKKFDGSAETVSVCAANKTAY
jgi:hypothetical protein